MFELLELLINLSHETYPYLQSQTSMSMCALTDNNTNHIYRLN